MSEVTVIDADNGIWTVEPPVRCSALTGTLVFCNEEVIGTVDWEGFQNYLPSYMQGGFLHTLDKRPSVEEAARAITVEVLGFGVWEHLVPDDSDDDSVWDQAPETYIKVGPS